MPVQMVTYDLRQPGQDYSGLFDAIQSLGPTWHCMESVWLVNSPRTSVQVREALNCHIDTNDSLLVADLAGGWATLGLPKNCTDWLRRFVSA